MARTSRVGGGKFRCIGLPDGFAVAQLVSGPTLAPTTCRRAYRRLHSLPGQRFARCGGVVNWLAIGSTGSVNAIDHIGQGSTPVYLSNGTLVTPSTTTAGLWSGVLVHQINLDLATNIVPPVNFVWTGTNPTGTGFGGPLGSATPQTGANTDTAGSWISSGRSPNGDLRDLYGISSDLTVPQSVVPEPATLTMLGTALSVGLAIGWTRHHRNRRRHRPEAEIGVRSDAPLN